MKGKRIIFVDPEANVLDALRRMLRRQREEWDMVFVSTAAQALGHMADKPADVLVTDLQMPGISGTDLLERAMKDYPQTVRIILCGRADESLTPRAIKAAHQYLFKPTDAETLKKAIASACAGQTVVQDARMREVLGGCQTLPSVPSIYFELTKAVESASTDARTISRIVSGDAALVAKLLQLVNSSFFGIGRRVSSIEQTVALLGVVRIKGLVLQEHLAAQFAPPRPVMHFSMEDFWRHSILVAEIARQITRSEELDTERQDQAFTAGLLHDIGKLILACRQTDRYEQILGSVQAGADLHEAERAAFGVSHAEIGAYLLRIWGIPDRIVEAVDAHHHPGEIAFDGLCALTAVHVADILVHRLIAGTAGEIRMDESYLERIRKAGRVEVWVSLAGEMYAKYAAGEAAATA